MTRNPVKDAWAEVGDQLEAIGLKMKLHFEQEASEDDDDDDGTFERLAEKLDAAVDAIGNAAEDEAVCEDLRETGRRLVDAMSTTYREARRGTAADLVMDLMVS
jgi:hypothetical protein